MEQISSLVVDIPLVLRKVPAACAACPVSPRSRPPKRRQVPVELALFFRVSAVPDRADTDNKIFDERYDFALFPLSFFSSLTFSSLSAVLLLCLLAFAASQAVTVNDVLTYLKEVYAVGLFSPFSFSFYRRCQLHNNGLHFRRMKCLRSTRI